MAWLLRAQPLGAPQPTLRKSSRKSPRSHPKDCTDHLGASAMQPWDLCWRDVKYTCGLVLGAESQGLGESPIPGEGPEQSEGL